MIDENNHMPEKEGAAFNAAVATLMRLDHILTDIKNLSLDSGIKIRRGMAQHLKWKMVKDFYVQSFPLIKDEEKKLKIKEAISRLIPKWKRRHPEYDWGIMPCYSDSFEIELDEALIQIQEALQESGYFMPEKVDRGL